MNNYYSRNKWTRFVSDLTKITRTLRLNEIEYNQIWHNSRKLESPARSYTGPSENQFGCSKIVRIVVSSSDEDMIRAHFHELLFTVWFTTPTMIWKRQEIVERDENEEEKEKDASGEVEGKEEETDEEWGGG